ncbi:MAG: hypothetical protein GX206_06675 [Clostridiales bacterium]|nr:hypothetical protein [Clostridiales bacterium]
MVYSTRLYTLFIDSRQAYVPLHTLPSWITALTGICIIGGLFSGCIINLLIGFCMSILYVRLGLEQKKNAIIGSFIGSTVIQLIVAILLVIAYNLRFQ